MLLSSLPWDLGWSELVWAGLSCSSKALCWQILYQSPCSLLSEGRWVGPWMDGGGWTAGGMGR